MKVIAIAKGFDGERRIDEGVIFDLKEKVGLDRNGNEKVFSIEEQFSKKWMKEYKGKSVKVTVDGDFDPENEEVVIMPKGKNKKARQNQVEEVI